MKAFTATCIMLISLLGMSSQGQTTYQVTDLGNSGIHGFDDYFHTTNNSGQYLGQIMMGGDWNEAVVYSGNTMKWVGPGDMDGERVESYGYSINNHGDVVGFGWFRHSRAFVYEDGASYNLNTLIAPSSGWILEVATGINDERNIVGYGINPQGQHDAYLLTPGPIPEPSAVALLAIGLIVTSSFRKRKV